MGLFSYSYVCISNNPNLKGHVQSLDYLDGGALDVLYKPNQQPYRSLILKKDCSRGGAIYLQSLDLIENAIRVFESSPKLMRPGELTERIDNDFRYLDFILLEETFHQYSVLTPPERRYPEAVNR